MNDIQKLAEKALDKMPSITQTKPAQIVEQMVSDLLAIPASWIREYAITHSFPNAVSYEIFNQSIFNKISSIDEEKLIEPELQVIGQAIEDSTYCYYHEELCSMFSSLIANSCNIDYVKIMHPSFSKTLKRMSPYDAVLLKKIATERNNATKTVEAAQYIASRNNFKEKIILHECIVFTDDYFSDFNMQSLSISALKQLGVIEYTQPEPFPLERFTKIEYFKFLQKQYREKDFIVTPYRVKVYLTPYANSLLTACSVLPLSNGQTP